MYRMDIEQINCFVSNFENIQDGQYQYVEHQLYKAI